MRPRSESGRTRPQIVSHREKNNFGLLRLLFATMVILSHSPELIDGNRSREILTRAFGTLSFGELGVDGFFLVSGFLIAKSLMNSGDVLEYLAKRVLRIYPGYIVAFLICWLLVGPLAGGDFAASDGWKMQLWRMATLQIPVLPGSFSDLHYPSLNGSMWTISYEFRCYILLIVLNVARSLPPPAKYAYIVSIMLAIIAMKFNFYVPYKAAKIVGYPLIDFRFFALFLTGSAFYIFRRKICYNIVGAIGAAVLLAPFMFFKPTAEPSVAVLGGYLVFCFAFMPTPALLSRIGTRVDLSYGLYLYAWPVQSLIIQWEGAISPWTLCGATILVAGGLGYVSWRLVERPFLNLKYYLQRPHQIRAARAQSR